MRKSITIILVWDDTLSIEGLLSMHTSQLDSKNGRGKALSMCTLFTVHRFIVNHIIIYMQNVAPTNSVFNPQCRKWGLYVQKTETEWLRVQSHSIEIFLMSDIEEFNLPRTVCVCVWCVSACARESLHCSLFNTMNSINNSLFFSLIFFLYFLINFPRIHKLYYSTDQNC